jgi:hypothetical protein
MKVGLSGSGVVALVGLGLLAALGIYVYMKGPAFIKKTVTETLNPASDQNIVNQGVTGVVSAATGREESLGGLIADKVFELMHPGFSFTAPVDLANPIPPASDPAPDSQLLGAMRAPIPVPFVPLPGAYTKTYNKQPSPDVAPPVFSGRPIYVAL